MSIFSKLFGPKQEPPAAPPPPPQPQPPAAEVIDALLERWSHLVSTHIKDTRSVPLSVVSMRAGGRAVPRSLQELEELDGVESLEYLTDEKVLSDLRREWSEQLTSPPDRALLVEIDHQQGKRPFVSFHYPEAEDVTDLTEWAEKEILARSNNFDGALVAERAKTKITLINLSEGGDATWRNGPALEHSRKIAASAERGVELVLEDLVSQAQTPPEAVEEIAEEVAEEPARKTKPQPPLTR